jgi:hypothetical protein
MNFTYEFVTTFKAVPSGEILPRIAFDREELTRGHDAFDEVLVATNVIAVQEPLDT